MSDQVQGAHSQALVVLMEGDQRLPKTDLRARTQLILGRLQRPSMYAPAVSRSHTGRWARGETWEYQLSKRILLYERAYEHFPYSQL